MSNNWGMCLTGFLFSPAKRSPKNNINVCIETCVSVNCQFRNDLIHFVNVAVQ